MTPARAAFLAASVAALVPAAAGADQTATWSGKVAYLNATRLGVEGNRERRDFIIDKSFDNIKTGDGKTATRDALTVGTYVRVVYTSSSLFGSARVTEIDVMPALLPIPSSSP